MPIAGDMRIDATSSVMTDNTGSDISDTIGIEIQFPDGGPLISDGDNDPGGDSDAYPDDYLVLGLDNVDNGTYELYMFVGPGFPPPTGSTGTFEITFSCATMEPTLSPTANPTTTPAPPQPGAVGTGSTSEGDYNDEAVVITVVVASQCDATFDASSSTISGVTLNITDSSGAVIGSGSSTVTVSALAAGNYTVTLEGDESEEGSFAFSFLCALDSSSDSDSDDDSDSGDSGDSDSDDTDSDDTDFDVTDSADNDSDSDGGNDSESASGTGTDSESGSGTESGDTDSDDDTSGDDDEDDSEDDADDDSDDDIVIESDSGSGSGSDSDSDSGEDSEDVSLFQCSGLSESICGTQYADDGRVLCLMNIMTKRCYAVVAASGYYGRGTYDQGYATASSELVFHTRQLRAIVGVLATIVMLLLVALIGGGYFVHQKVNEMEQIADESIMSETVGMKDTDDKHEYQPSYMGHHEVYSAE